MMCGTENSEPFSQVMSLLYCHSSEFSEGKQGKIPELTVLSINQHHIQQQQQQQHSFGLTRYCSAPSTLLESMIGNNGGGGINSPGSEDIRYLQSTGPEVESIFARFLSSSGSGDLESAREFGERFTKQSGYLNGTQMLCQNPQANSSTSGNTAPNGNTIRDPFAEMNSRTMENLMQVKTNGGNISNLIRQSSSPAGFFSNLTADNVGGMDSHMNFSNEPPKSSRSMLHTSGLGHKTLGTGSLENGNSANCRGSKRQRQLDFPYDSWDDSAFHCGKIAKDNTTTDSIEFQNGSCTDHSSGLTHHLSLPRTFAEMDAAENFLNFQDAIPCKIRAKRGFATHPRSIAERIRRTRISERIRKLQELFPDIDKHTNTADMLDMAVEYIKNLQEEVKTLTDAKAKCMCLSKQKE